MTRNGSLPDAAAQVLEYWFETLSSRDWFAKNHALDRELGERFGATRTAALRCELWPWRASSEGRLAEIIVIDQFSRNMFRGHADAFAGDPLALALAQEAVAQGADQALPAVQQAFIYMPYMHSESLLVHDEALRLFGQPGLETQLKHEHQHRAVLERFGRYPQRNAALGRDNSDAEQAFLATPGSTF